LYTRVIPILLIHKGGLVKSVKFKNYKYVGDPINAVRIFNDKECDELAIIDIDATREGRGPNMRAIADIVSEAFMPISYGGGITELQQAKELFYNGIEKVVINKAAHTNPALISSIANQYGNQSVVVSIDVKKNLFGKKKIAIDNANKTLDKDIVAFAKQMETAGAGEILLNSVDNDGTYNGYDLDLLKQIAGAVSIPVIICGGASAAADFSTAIENGASAVAAGSMFVFQRPHQAVLISYLSQDNFKI
jgi:imidazole glycerol-phosphate synthase subunit HisF